MAPSAADWRSLADFVLACMLVLATPGPNMLLVGAAAALRGVAGVLPLCLGVALGAGVLSAAWNWTRSTAASCAPSSGTGGCKTWGWPRRRDCRPRLACGACGGWRRPA